MRAVIQKTCGAAVRVGTETVGSFSGPGLVVLLGFTQGDGAEQVDYLVRRLVKLQVFDPEDLGADPELGPQSILEAELPVLLVSQFTLYGSVKKGRKPSWTHAASGEEAEPLYELAITRLREAGVAVETGRFGAMMEVSLTNHGPFTLWIEK